MRPAKNFIQPSCRLSAKCANRRSGGFVQRLAIRIGDLQNHRETMCGVIRLDLAHDLNAQRMWRLAPDGRQRLPNVPVDLRPTFTAVAFPSLLTPSGRRASIAPCLMSPRRARREPADHSSHCWRRSRARRRAGVESGARGAGLSSRSIRKLARRPFWSARRNYSVSIA